MPESISGKRMEALKGMDSDGRTENVSEDENREKSDTDIITEIRRQHPLIHIISNTVTLNDVVNITLAAGATAICANAPEETEEITSIAKGLLLNTGTPSRDRMEAMLCSGRRANALGIPVTLDPVGAGASAFRTEFIRELLGEVCFDAIRCNMSEIAALYGLSFRSRGVEDAGANLSDEQLKEFADKHDCILVVTGIEDKVVSSDEVRTIAGGTPMLKRITGSGCMLSALVAAAMAAGSEAGTEEKKVLRGMEKTGHGSARQRLDAAEGIVRVYDAAAVAAEEKAAGTASFRMHLIDEISVTGI